MSRLSCAAFFAILLFSCGTSKTDDTPLIVEISPVDSFEVVVPNPYYPTFKWNIVQDTGDLTIAEYGHDNSGNLVIYYINLIEQRYEKELIIEREGPNGYNSTTCEAFIHNMDSIFVFPAVKDEFYIYNSKGIKISTFKYNSTNDYGFFSSSTLVTLPKNGDNLIINTSRHLRFDDKNFFKKNIPFHSYSLINNKLSPLFSYPEYLHGKYLPPQFWGGQSIFVNDSLLAINFHFARDVEIYNINSGTTTTIPMGFSNPIEPLNYMPEMYEGLEIKIKEDFYPWINSYNNKLYRLANHLIKEEYKKMPPAYILENNLRTGVLIEYDLVTSKLKFIIGFPLTRHFIFKDNRMYVGSVSIREDEDMNTFKKYYIYDLDN